jgi:hypothetical protein
MTMMGRDDFEEVEVLRDETGAIAVINRNKHTGYYSFAFFKEFEHRGERRRSAFLSRRHSLGIRRLAARVEQFLDPRVDKEMVRGRTD